MWLQVLGAVLGCCGASHLLHVSALGHLGLLLFSGKLLIFVFAWCNAPDSTHTDVRKKPQDLKLEALINGRASEHPKVIGECCI